MKLVITGGHHTSALPVIKEIKKRDSDADIYWIGHKHSIQKDKNETLEYKEITDLDIPFFELQAGKVYRTFNIFRILKIHFSIIQAFFYLRKIKPDIVLSFGGYLAAPVVLMAWMSKIPTITHEQTVVAGYANKFISLFANKILLTWKESEKFFKERDTTVVGLPLRSEILESESNNFKTNPGLPTIYITAGKTGSHIINEVILNSYEELLQVCNVIHQCGDTSLHKDYSNLKAKSKVTYTPGKYNLRKFVFSDEIGEAFNKSDLVVGRSGAHMIYELLALEKPAVLIPIPWASHNEQFENARLLKETGLAKIIKEKNLTPTLLVRTVAECLDSLDTMKFKGTEVKHALVSNAAELIVDEIYKTITQ
jgi:UDP-N-acetylglucosamine--N-acetylmuramyl-(pentapeptide) pyrophosphoryl-undecaprenol N-acetylglucosamine transferase